MGQWIKWDKGVAKYLLIHAYISVRFSISKQCKEIMQGARASAAAMVLIQLL